MNKKSFLKKNNTNFYLPGEEINIRRQDMFVNWDDKSNNGYMAKGRILFGMLCASFAYLLVAFRLLDTCVLPNLNDDDTPAYVQHQNIHRADIVDRNGAIVATSLPTKDLDANTKNILSPRQTAEKLTQIFPELKFETVYKRLRHPGTVTIRRNLTPHQQSQIMALGNPGLEFRSGEKRVYPHKNLLAHVIGLADVDNNGTAGIEKGLNERITTSDVPVQLALDIGVQDTVRTILAENMQKYNAKAATAVLMNANTGEIVASVSLPDFDPNNIKSQDIDSMLNTVTARVYEPGSVLKVFNTAMALDSGKVKVSEKFDTTQPLKLRYNTIKEYHGQNRWLSVEEVLVYSSNVGSARMALQAGFNEQYNFFKKAKFLERLKTEVVEMERPIIPKYDSWKRSDSAVATLGYGYSISLSPLHLISAYSAVINGGIYHNPTFLARSNPEAEGERILSDNTSKQMRQLVRAVVTKGSGRNANVAGYEVGGKTGTANKLGPKGEYIDNAVRATFMSAFPISNPQYALLVMLDEPKMFNNNRNTRNAGWNAVPTSAQIIAAVAPQLNVPANYDIDDKRNAKIIEASFER